ncbi:MAG: T9SS type A sorting domain-containing protein [Bacteroidota bacterium]
MTNPSFENVSECPFSLDLEAYTSDWKSARESPDYFNTCSTSSVADVPNNNFGYQQPYSGNAYIGMLTYRSDSCLYTEAASVQLISPLLIGQTYYVSLRVNLTIDNITESNSANNKIGVQFSRVNYSPNSPSPINNFAHIWSDLIITDTLNWTIISGSFVSDSVYNYLNLGNFFDKPFVDTITFGTVFGAYYFIDDVCVSTDSLYTVNYSYTSINENENNRFKISPNPVSDILILENIHKTMSYEIFDIIGNLIDKNNIDKSNNSIDVSKFPNGIYYLILNEEVSKFIISH